MRFRVMVSFTGNSLVAMAVIVLIYYLAVRTRTYDVDRTDPAERERVEMALMALASHDTAIQKYFSKLRELKSLEADFTLQDCIYLAC